MAEPGECPYVPQEFPVWTDAVDGWAWEDWLTDSGHRMGWRKRGVCPRCRHKMSLYDNFVYAVDVQLDTPKTELAGCNCRKPHKDRPDDAPFEGCGAGGVVRRAP